MRSFDEKVVAPSDDELLPHVIRTCNDCGAEIFEEADDYGDAMTDNFHHHVCGDKD